MSEPTSRPVEAPSKPSGGEGGGWHHLLQTFKHGSVYGLSQVLSRLVGFIMIPVYTRVLTRADYGVLELLTMATNVLGMIASVGLTVAVTRYVYVYEDRRDQYAVVSTTAIMLVSFVGVAALIAMSFASAVAEAVLGSSEYTGFVRLAIVGFFLSKWVELPLVVLRAKQRSGLVFVLSATRLFLAVTLNILFLVVLRMGVRGVLLTTIITAGTIGTFLMIGMLREAGVRFDPKIARRLVHYGAPLIAASLASFVLHFSDRWFLQAFRSLDEVGLYSLGYRFAMLLSVFVATPFAMIWTPKALQLNRDRGEDAKPILRRILSWYNVVLTAAGLGIALFASDVIKFVAGSNFHDAGRAVPILSVAMVFYGYRQFARVGAWVTEHSGFIATSTAVAAVVVLVANFTLIPTWGMMGAAVATVLAFATEFGVTLWRSRRVYRLDYPLHQIVAPLAVATAAYAAVELLTPAGAGLLLILGAKVTAMAIAVAVMVYPLELPPQLRLSRLRALRGHRD